MKAVFLAVIALVLTGCASSNRIYEWGGYDQLLYQAYKSPEKTTELRLGLEANIAALETHNQRVPPGLYAELGTLYLQANDPAKAVVMYGKERDTWPESKWLMGALIASAERRVEAKAAKP